MRALDELDEERLVRLVARGDRGAFDELYRRTSPWLAVRLRRRCADEQIVAEVMQETYLAVWRAAGAFAGSAVGGTAVGWLWTIAARRLVDAFRRRAHHAEPPVAAAERAVVPAAEDEALAGTVDGDVGDRSSATGAGTPGGSPLERGYSVLRQGSPCSREAPGERTCLRIELKRSIGTWPGAVVLAGSLAVLLLIDGIWGRVTRDGRPSGPPWPCGPGTC
ncbi:hypothetical protein SHIRM173S_00013 [Streptomyces hirsutus]